MDRGLGGLHDGHPRRGLAGRRGCPLHVPALRRGRRGRLEGRRHGARRRLHHRPDRDLRHRHRALGAAPERHDPGPGRGTAPVRRCRAGEGLGRRRGPRLDRSLVVVAQPLRDRQPGDARLGAPDRRLHLLGLGVGGEPDRRDRGLTLGARAGSGAQHGDPARDLRLGRRRRSSPSPASRRSPSSTTTRASSGRSPATCSGRPGTSS